MINFYRRLILNLVPYHPGTVALPVHFIVSIRNIVPYRLILILPRSVSCCGIPYSIQQTSTHLPVGAHPQKPVCRIVGRREFLAMRCLVGMIELETHAGFAPWEVVFVYCTIDQSGIKIYFCSHDFRRRNLENFSIYFIKFFVLNFNIFASLSKFEDKL